MSTVVVVAKDRELRALLCGMLVDEGITVVGATDAVEAVARIAGLDDAPDAILLDRRIARGAEGELVESMRSRTRLRNVPIVLFTAHGSTGPHAAPLERLRDAFDAELLLAIVQGICRTDRV